MAMTLEFISMFPTNIGFPFVFQHAYNLQFFDHRCLVMTSKSDPKKAGAAAQYVAHLDHLRLLHDSMRRTEATLQKALALQADLAAEIEQNETLEQRTMRTVKQRSAIDEIVTACKSVIISQLLTAYITTN
jgi:hypothetical protein